MGASPPNSILHLRNIHRTTLLQRSRHFTCSIAEVLCVCFFKVLSGQTQCQSGRSGAPFRTGSYFPLATTPFIEKSKNKFTSTIASLYLFNSRCALRPFFQSRFRSNPAPVAAFCERRRAPPTGGHRHARSGRAVPQNPPAKPRNREGFFKSSRRDAETQGKES